MSTARAYFEYQWTQTGRATVEEVLSALNVDSVSESGKAIIMAILPLEISRRQLIGEQTSLTVEVARFPLLQSQIYRELSNLLSASGSKVDRIPELAKPGSVPPSGEANPTVSVHEEVLAGTTIVRSERDYEYVGRYRLERLLGRGGFGEVWLAFDTELEREVAVKVLRQDRLRHLKAVDDLLKEGRRVASLKHHGIVPIYDIGCVDGKLYLVSELVQCGTLSEKLKSGLLPIPQAITLAAAIAEALHHAHLRGIVHRDVKPHNILIGSDELPRVTDFGIAVTEDEQIAETPGTVGTYAYMSPEQIRGESHLADPRSDIYSLGVVLYEMLTGRVPYVAKTVEQYREQILGREPRPPRTINDKISPDLEQIVLKCLAKAVADRYTTAADVSKQLLAQLHGPPQRRKWPVWQLVAGIAGIIGLVLIWQKDPEKISEPTVQSLVASVPTQPSPAVGSPQDSHAQDQWAKHYGMKPTEIIWPGWRGRSTISWNEDPLRVFLSSDHPLLLQFGTVPVKGPAKIQVRCEHASEWSSGGLFWDYQVFDDGPERFAKYQSLHIRDFLQGTGSESSISFQLVRTQNMLNPKTGGHEIRGESVVRIDHPSTRQAVFEIEFMDSIVTAVRSGQREFPELVSTFDLVFEIPGSPVNTPSRSVLPWGVYVTNGTFQFLLPLP